MNKRHALIGFVLGISILPQVGAADLRRARGVIIPSPFADPIVPSKSDAGDSNAKVSPTAAIVNFKIRTGLITAPDKQGRMAVTAVREDSPAARAGVKQGDLLLRLDDTQIDDQDGLEQYVTAHAHAGAFMVTLQRAEKPFTLALGRTSSLLGMLLFPDSVDRPIVQQVFKESPADKAGIRPGDVITGVNDRMTDSIQQFGEVALPLIRSMREGQALPVRYVRDGATIKTALIRPAIVDMPLLPPPIDPNLIPRRIVRTTTRKAPPPRAHEPQGGNRKRPPNQPMSNAEFLGELQNFKAPQRNGRQPNSGTRTQVNVNTR
jgi:S1-C subfamily serine protease